MNYENTVYKHLTHSHTHAESLSIRIRFENQRSLSSFDLNENSDK